MKPNKKDFFIPTYIINLETRKERRKHIYEEFRNKNEFKIEIVNAVKDEIGAVGLWKSIIKIIKIAQLAKDEIILICEDDHMFTENYDKNYLFYNIAKAEKKNVELLMGGVSGFGMAVPVSHNLYWIDWYWGNQFIIIFKSFFETILNFEFKNTDQADIVLSNLTSRKMVLYPFVSIQKNFGYSDVTDRNNNNPALINNMFIKSNYKLQHIHNINLWNCQLI